jgi:hypothetical protein
MLDDKKTIIIDEEPKYKKKSQSKGLPRSKHKHIYETVLLHHEYHYTSPKTGKDVVVGKDVPTKVCTVCGRIEYVDYDPSYYELIQSTLNPPFIYEKVLTEKALSLPKWRVEGTFDKFAVKIEEETTK